MESNSQTLASIRTESSNRNSPLPSPDAFEQALRRRLRGEVAFDAVTRGIYSTDASNYQIQPRAVVIPRDEADVLAAVAVAADFGVPILPRGAGTSLAGQTVGAALVIDFSRYLNQVLEVNLEERWVRVQPGVVRDELNAQLAPHGLHFAPDPATTSRANVGGMIGNNSSGTKSIIYGKTVDHVLETRVLLADGEMIKFAEVGREEYDALAARDDRQGRLLRGFREIIDAHRAEIAERFPKVMRRVGGYNLDEFHAAERWNLSKLITGSEGTLAVLLEAKLNLEPLPKAKALCVAHFAEIGEAIRAVPPIVKHGPSAVEILDHGTLELGRHNLVTAPLMDFLQGEPAAILIVEFFGDTPEEVKRRADGMITDLKARGLGYAHPLFTEPAAQTKVWQVRERGLGLMLGMKGDAKPLSFIEDCAVPVEVLPEYIDRVLKICRRHETPVAMYAHASVGVIHVQPILDLRFADHIERMKAIAEETFELVREYGGAWSGEHGDGLARSPWNERFFGPRLYRAFKQVKALFDPRGLMNPGKIIDAEPIDHNLRFGTQYQTPAPETHFHYREAGGFASAVHMCTGVGACRKRLTGTMCPSYIATMDERHTTRGRANALRLAMSGQLGPDALTGHELREVLDLCLSCKGCKAECPSNVDMARLKGETMQMMFDRHGLTARDRMIGGARRAAEWFSGWPAPLVNWAQGSEWFRAALEKWAGFDRRRRLPKYARETFIKWFDRRGARGFGGGGASDRSDKSDRSVKSNVAGGPAPQVVLFEDTFLNYHEPRVGRAAVELLESCGYEVIPARAGCCQRPRISHGLLRDAARFGEETLRRLDNHIRQGRKIVVCEPSCASALVDDLPDLIEDEALGERMRRNVMMIDQFLEEESLLGRIAGGFTSPAKKILIHGHCHQKALFGTAAMKSLLGRVEGLEVREVDSGCCGMAGAFGYEVEHYELSQKIGEDRLFPALRGIDGQTTVVACGFSCRHQIKDAVGVEARHWVEVVRGNGKRYSSDE